MKWIKISERLPEDSQYCLFFGKDNDEEMKIMAGKFGKNDNYFWFDMPGGCCCPSSLSDEIMYWMPIEEIELPNEIECDCDDDFDCDKHREAGSLEERALRLAQEMRDQSGIIEELRSPAHIPTINKNKWSSETFKDLKPLPVSNDL